jgi:hypothetical protein
MIYKILTGCYIVAALVLVAACNDGLDIQRVFWHDHNSNRIN